MLGIRGLGRGAAAYYLGDNERALPGPARPSWVGSGSRALGLHGEPSSDGVRRLFEGRHPGSGVPLGSGRTTVAAYDLTFSAPKSVSVLFALGGRDVAAEVVAAHRVAVAGALDYVERHALSAVRRAAHGREVLAAGGMVAVQLIHARSRNDDPHLHSHVVLANVVHAEDGRWRAGDRRGLDAHRAAASAVYEAGLRAGLGAALGVRWVGVPGRAPEVSGVPQALMSEFSSRSADIRRHAHEAGARSARGRRVAWAATREAKGPDASFEELAATWRDRARAVVAGGDGLPGRTTTAGPRPDGIRQPVLDEHRFSGVIWATPHGGVHRRDVVVAFASGAMDGIGATALERVVESWVPSVGVGVREPLLARGDVVPAGSVLEALGPRPLESEAHAVWLGAARCVEDYRRRWGLPQGHPVVGPGVAATLVACEPERLAAFVRVQRTVAAARSRLGRIVPAAPELGLTR